MPPVTRWFIAKFSKKNRTIAYIRVLLIHIDIHIHTCAAHSRTGVNVWLRKIKEVISKHLPFLTVDIHHHVIANSDQQSPPTRLINISIWFSCTFITRYLDNFDIIIQHSRFIWRALFIYWLITAPNEPDNCRIILIDKFKGGWKLSGIMVSTLRKGNTNRSWVIIKASKWDDSKTLGNERTSSSDLAI